ncbi:MAG TPA: hypothetical protein PKE26_15995 [Kiritimatiellia bacterium]|nr:hypothetical protein [Kiritimatiellia bacterium]HMP00599.1 hypothetical protein [Kiritimatiellia bacterium]HMP98091.1 hypothetical protein [Kiritimatiellia bacterium]
MKTSNLITMGLAAALVAGMSTPARAMNKEWAAVAGFVGGVLVANSAYCRPATTVYHQPRVVYQQPVVVYESAPVVVHQRPSRVVVRHEPVRRGYYEWRTERVWVPGTWIYEDLGCGSRRKIWQPGYYETVRNKVWVDPCGW